MDKSHRTHDELVEAKTLLETALSLDSTSALSHYRMGEVLRLEGKKTEALSSLRTAASLATETAWLWSHLGGQLIEAREFEEADKALTHAERLNRDDMLTQFRLGRLAEERGDIASAVQRMSRALSVDSSQAWLWRHYSNLLNRAGKPEEAKGASMKAQQLL